MRDPNLIDSLNSSLSPPGRHAIAALIQEAQLLRLTLYLVGGSLRDLLLLRPTLDVDLTLEGDAVHLARRAASHLPNVRCVAHSAFGTATLKGPDFRLDLATARAESYERPGALPSVRPGSIQDDLRRRDFTINAIALALTGKRRGALVDPCGGRTDLAARVLRVIHEASFRDDATRILRGARYECRLSTILEPRTLRWLKRDIGYLETISGPRLRDELLRVLREPEPERVLLRLNELGALRAIHPALSLDSKGAAAFARLRRIRRDPHLTTRFALLAWPLSSDQASSLAARLSLNRRETQAVLAAPQARALHPKLTPDLRPSRTADLLSPLPSPAIWVLAASAPEPASSQALRYLRRLRHVKPALDGHALLALGAAPGPPLGEMLSRLKAAKLDGEVRTRRDEERLARKLLGASPKAGLQAGRPPDRDTPDGKSSA